MKHLVYSVDIATKAPLTDKEVGDLIMKFDAVLAEYPIEFEDWKVKTYREERPI